MPALSFNHLGPLGALSLRGGVSAGELAWGAAVLAMLLGHAAYTDLFRGRVIRNTTNACIALGALAFVPLIFAHPWHHLLWSGIVIALIVLLYVGRLIPGEGDAKLYGALAIVFAQGTVILAFISFFVVILYGLPLLVRNHVEAHRQHRSAGLTKAPMAPGIALAYPLTLLAAGATWTQTFVLVGVGVGVLLLNLVYDRILGEKEPFDGAKRLDSGGL